MKRVNNWMFHILSYFDRSCDSFLIAKLLITWRGTRLLFFHVMSCLMYLAVFTFIQAVIHTEGDYLLFQSLSSVSLWRRVRLTNDVKERTQSDSVPQICPVMNDHKSEIPLSSSGLCFSWVSETWGLLQTSNHNKREVTSFYFCGHCLSFFGVPRFILRWVMSQKSRKVYQEEFPAVVLDPMVLLKTWFLGECFPV
jgi:hypothetical protein